MSYLQLRGIEKKFGALRVIQGIDLEIQRGEFVVFVGPSGCGKSTLLRLIAGLEQTDAGSVMLDGRDITEAASSQRDLAMVFQSYALYPHMSVFENMSFALKLAHVPHDQIREKVERAARILNLTEYLQRTPKELSGGQRQRVAIGRAIVRAPKVFLFDEPLSNLDAALRGQTRIEIAKLHRDLGATTVYVTHDQVEAMTLADRVVVLRDGRIEQVGTLQAGVLDPLAQLDAKPSRVPSGLILMHTRRLEGEVLCGLDASSVAQICPDDPRVELIERERPVGIVVEGLEDLLHDLPASAEAEEVLKAVQKLLQVDAPVIGRVNRLKDFGQLDLLLKQEGAKVGSGALRILS